MKDLYLSKPTYSLEEVGLVIPNKPTSININKHLQKGRSLVRVLNTIKGIVEHYDTTSKTHGYNLIADGVCIGVLDVHTTPEGNLLGTIDYGEGWCAFFYGDLNNRAASFTSTDGRETIKGFNNIYTNHPHFGKNAITVSKSDVYLGDVSFNYIKPSEILDRSFMVVVPLSRLENLSKEGWRDNAEGDWVNKIYPEFTISFLENFKIKLTLPFSLLTELEVSAAFSFLGVDIVRLGCFRDGVFVTGSRGVFSIIELAEYVTKLEENSLLHK